ALVPPRRSMWYPSSKPEVSCHTSVTCVGELGLATSPVGAEGAGLGTAEVHPICATVNAHKVDSFMRIMHSVEARVHARSWQFPFSAFGRTSGAQVQLHV